MRRLATAAVLLPSTWAVVRFASPSAFAVVVGILSAVVTWECLAILAGRGERPLIVTGVVSAFLLAWSYGAGVPWFDASAALVLGIVAVSVGSISTRGDPGAMLGSAMATLYPLAWVGIGLGHLARLRAIPGAGVPLVGLLILCVIGADTFAYYTGRALGRHPMSPRISPKKTWEGAAGGLAGSLAGAVVSKATFYPELRTGHVLLVALALAAAALLGDLAESVVKRAGEVKDSSRLLPGHGGFFDRLDSMLFAAPLLYHYYRWAIAAVP